MAAFAVPLMIAGTAIQAIGAIQQGNAQAAQYQAQAQGQEYNARVSRSQAEAAGQQWSAREDAQRRQARQILGKQLAATAQSGVNLNGSAADIFRESMVNAEQDALNIRYEGEMTRTGLLNQAQLSDYEASAFRSAAKSARRAGYMSAAAAIASGGYAYSKLPAGAPADSGGVGLKGTGGGFGLKGTGGGFGLKLRY